VKSSVGQVKANSTYKAVFEGQWFYTKNKLIIMIV
jgi:hypothetical protein